MTMHNPPHPGDWQELPHRRDCRIVQYRNGDIEDRTQWSEQHAWLLERLEAFKRTFSERVQALDLGADDAEETDDVEETA